MREKAEREIRNAVSALGNPEYPEIDKVRDRCGLIRKVFDKTILDMARVGTITLFGKKAVEMNPADIEDYITRGDMVYMSFTFIDGTHEPEPAPKPVDPPVKPASPFQRFRKASMQTDTELVNVVLEGVNVAEWELFEFLCKHKENKTAGEKLMEMIRRFNREQKT